MACTHGRTFFQPTTHWTQDSDNHILRVCLPGFRKDEFKVQVDNCGRLTVRGGRALGDGKYMCMEQVFDVPKDSQIDKIRGKFEDARLSLFMPKKVVEAAAVSCEKEKTVEPQPPAKVCDKKTEEPIQKETPKCVAATPPPAKVCDKKTEEPIQKETPKCVAATPPPAKVCDKKTEEPIQKETPAATPEPAAVPSADKKKEEQPVQQEKPTPERKPRSSLVGDDQFEEYKKKAIAWKVRIEEGVEGWLDYGLMDGLLETISKNQKTIAIAAAAFFAGFYISRKLRSSG